MNPARCPRWSRSSGRCRSGPRTSPSTWRAATATRKPAGPHRRRGRRAGRVDHKRGLRPFDLADPDARRRAGLPQPRRLRPPRAAPRRRRRLGDHGQRARRHLREAAPRASRATTTRSSTTTTTSSARSPRSSTTRRPRTASSTRPRACRTPSSTTAPALHIVHGDISRGGHVMVNIRKFTGVAFRDLDELVERDMLPRRGRRVPRAPASGPGCRSCSPVRPGSGKTTLLSCCCGRARPGAAGRRRRGGLRGRRPAAERRQHADPRRPAPTARRSTCAGSSPASCAWRPTWPSSARSATGRRCRCS